MTTPSEAALQLLTDLGIEARLYEGALFINRTSMVNFSNTSGEQPAYDEVLAFLVDEFPSYWVMWSGRSDEEFGVEFYVRKGTS